MAEWMETCPNHQYLLLLASQVPTDPYLAISPPQHKTPSLGICLHILRVQVLFFSMQCWSTEGSWGWFEPLTQNLPGHFWSVPPEPHWIRAHYEICCLPSHQPKCKSGVFSVPGISTLFEGSAGFCPWGVDMYNMFSQGSAILQQS